MDHRCPKKLKYLPDGYCDLAVLRLKQIRANKTELSEDQEVNLSGCNYCINHQQSSYCFFKYLSQYLEGGTPPSDQEIAHLCSLSLDTVKKVFKDALNKFEKSDMITKIKNNRDGEPVIDNNRSDDEEYEIKF